jgi:hypothetical protein
VVVDRDDDWGGRDLDRTTVRLTMPAATEKR